MSDCTCVTDLRGRRLASFFAAASIEAAAPSNSFSAITVGSSGSTQSVPKHNKLYESMSYKALVVKNIIICCVTIYLVGVDSLNALKTLENVLLRIFERGINLLSSSLC